VVSIVNGVTAHFPLSQGYYTLPLPASKGSEKTEILLDADTDFEIAKGNKRSLRVLSHELSTKDHPANIQITRRHQ